MSEKITIKVSRVAHDTEYYNNVFKKTEKIVSVIFYILSELKTNLQSNVHHDTVKAKTLALHETVLASLSLQHHERSEGLFTLQYALVALESTLRVAEAAGVFAPELGRLLYPELDIVQRYLKHHYLDESSYVFTTSDTTSVSASAAARSVERTTNPAPARPTAPRRLLRSQIPAGDISTDAFLVYSQLTDRAERIKTVLEAKPEATIKDLAEVITDVSEKTIQRELNSLIEKGQVIRQGERRWSKYSIYK